MFKLKRNKLFILVLSFVLILSITGCKKETGSTSGDTGKENNATEGNNKDNEGDKKDQEKPVKVEYANGASDSAIKVGTVGVQSGPLAFIGTPYFAGMEAYFKKK